MEQPKYIGCSITSISDVCSILSLSSADLEDIVAKPGLLYRQNRPRIKTDGTERITTRVLSPLKDIQRELKFFFDNNIYYPEYLMGGILGRGYIQDSLTHKKSEIVIQIDIKEYFNNITTKHIENIFNGLFGCPPEISHLLTRLVSYKNRLPQGASTSSHLANLVFFDIESEIVEKISLIGWTYTRYVDDITISKKTKYEEKEISNIIQIVSEMLQQKGFVINKSKQRIDRKSTSRPIHNLHTNRNILSPQKISKNYLRSALNHLKILYNKDAKSSEYFALYNKIKGQIVYFNQFNITKGGKFLEAIKEFEPIGN